MRPKQFALRVIQVYLALPSTAVAQVIEKQVLRSGTSVGPHNRGAFRSRSDAEFISKLECGLQGLDETEYWLELLVESDTLAAERLAEIPKEASELIAIFTTCVKTAKSERKHN